MPRTSARGGPQTRAHIREVANQLFLDRGYDAVTVAEVARAAGVSSVTVFNHFPRKEDLFLDRTSDAIEFLQSAVRDRPAGSDVLSALQRESIRLFDAGHPLSGVDERSASFFRTVANSPALVARSREILSELQRTLAAELEQDPSFDGDGTLFGTLFLAGYASVLVGTARRVIGGDSIQAVRDNHRERLDRMFDALRTGLR